MKRSIRTTFIGLFIGLLAMVLLAVWAMNSFFLENYYLNDKCYLVFRGNFFSFYHYSDNGSETLIKDIMLCLFFLNHQ